MELSLKHLFKAVGFLFEESFVDFGFVSDLLAQVEGGVVGELYV